MKSMTGYGRAVGVVLGLEVQVELRSLNHRYRDVHLNLPPDWQALETHVEAALRSRIERGRVECRLRSRGERMVGKPTLAVPIAQGYLEAYRALADLAGCASPPDLSALLLAPGVVGFGDQPIEADDLWPGLEPMVQKALQELDGMRTTEGARLEQELLARVDGIRRGLAQVQTRIPAERQALFDRARERMRELAGDSVSEERLQQEAAVWAEKADVTEELVRLHSHLDQMGALFREHRAIGRNLDFLLQEINREVTTFSSKIRSADLGQQMVAIKAEVEKMREQAQNIE